jgi:Domain of unknown function (DUF4189)
VNLLNFPLCRAAVVLLAVALVQALLPQTQAQPANTTYYAAIAFSPSTGRYGYTYGWLSSTNARRASREKCKAADAQVIVVVGNGYAALALGDDPSAYGYGYGQTAADARRHALAECQKRTTNCYIAVCVHSWAG